MNDILFGNNNTKIIRSLSKKYFKKNRIRNVTAILAITMTAFLFTSIISLAFNMTSSLQLSMFMQKGSKADGTLGYMTEEQYRQLVESDFIQEAGHRRFLAYASNPIGHTVEINYADSVQQELTFCAPTHGAAPQQSNEIITTDRALKALGVEVKIGASVPIEFEVRGQTYHYDMVLSGWWETNNDTVSRIIVSEQFVEENPELFKNTYAADGEMVGLIFSDVVLKNKVNIKGQLEDFAYMVGGDPENMEADNYILCSENQMTQGMTSRETILFAAVFALLFVVCGYLLIYNVFDISVMQDVRQYGLLRTIGTSSRQIKKLVNRQALCLTLISLPIGLATGFLAGWLVLPVAMSLFSSEHKSVMSALQVSTSPLIFIIASMFTILTVYISTRKPAKRAAKVSPLEAVRYTEQGNFKRKPTKRTQGAKLSRMALSNFGRNKRRSVFIIISLLLCIVFVNSAVVITQSIDEEKFISRNTKTDYTIYNSIVANVYEGFRYHSDELPTSVIDFINQQPGIENGRSLYRNTLDDTNVLVDYGIENISCTGTWEEDDGRINKAYGNYSMAAAPETENLFYGNIYGASEQFFFDLTIFDGEQDAEVLKQKMQSGEYVILGCSMDRLTGEPKETPLTEQLQVGDSISFYKDGELFKTFTILARAKVVGTEIETASSTSAETTIGKDAPRLYMADSMFMQLYDNPTIFSYGFDVSEGQEAQIEAFLNNFTASNPTVAYTSTEVLKQYTNSVQNTVLLVGGMIAAIMAFAGLINFTNMMITSIITRRNEFATMQSIGMTNRQLRRLMVYEGLYYAAGADIVGSMIAAIFALTVLENALNAPSMWYFTMHFTLAPALIVALVYVFLATVIPAIALHFFNNGTVVERLRTAE